jgi:hypothetical protein
MLKHWNKRKKIFQRYFPRRNIIRIWVYLFFLYLPAWKKLSGWTEEPTFIIRTNGVLTGRNVHWNLWNNPCCLWCSLTVNITMILDSQTCLVPFRKRSLTTVNVSCMKVRFSLLSRFHCFRNTRKNGRMNRLELGPMRVTRKLTDFFRLTLQEQLSICFYYVISQCVDREKQFETDRQRIDWWLFGYYIVACRHVAK